MSKESKLIKNTAIIAVGNICTKCISFFMLPLYTSILSTSEYGTVDIIGTYTSLLVIIMTLQFEQGLFRYLVEVRDDQQKQRCYITATYTVISLVVLLFTCISAFVLTVINYEYTFYLVASVVVGTLNSITLQIPRGLGNNKVYAVGSFLSGSTTVIMNVVLVAILRLGVDGMLIAGIIASATSMVYVMVTMRLPQLIEYGCFDRLYLKSLMQYSLPLVPYTLCWWVISASDRMIINIFLGTSLNGIYAAANKFPSLFSMITNIFQISWTESASESVSSADRDAYYSKIFDKTIRLYSSANMGIISVMPFLFSRLIGKDFSGAYYYIPILLFAAFFHAVAALYGSVYFAFKETKKISTTTFLAAVINFVVNICFVNSIGLYAAAISSVISYGVIILIRHYDVQSMAKITISAKYVFSELIIYILVLFGYYIGGQVLQIALFAFVLAICCVRNLDIIVIIWKYAVDRIKRSN